MAGNYTILIIEDNLMNLEMAKDLLEIAGFHTLEAVKADIGIKIATEQKPDLILMDLHLPGMSGYEASKILKSNAETEKIPIVAFTALAKKEEWEKAAISGCIGIISKPIDVDYFSDTVKGFLTSRTGSPQTN